jgi:2OG-Fe(II) oxygenase superfamily
MSRNAPPLVYQRTYNPATKGYTNQWTILHHRPETEDASAIVLKLERGGVVTIFPNLIDQKDRDAVTNEILQYRYPPTKGRSNITPTDNDIVTDDDASHQWQNDDHCLSLFRQYQVQTCNEPRLNCLLHTKTIATALSDTGTKSTPQPGYRYGKVTMKARSYKDLPSTLQFTKKMELVYENNKNDSKASTSSSMTPEKEGETDDSVFNIGAHILLYRDAHDSMGFHADDDQEESYILTAIMSQKHVRHVVFKPKRCADETNKDVLEVHYKLELSEGDAYSMDGTKYNCMLFALKMVCGVVSLF